MPILVWFISSKLGRLALVGALVAAAAAGLYGKGRHDGRAGEKARVERQINDAKETGNAARERALRDFDAAPVDSVPNDGFQRP